MRRVGDACWRIQAALITLMREKVFEKIKVSDIIRCAGVSRSTYYYHYYLSSEILEDIVSAFLGGLDAIFETALKHDAPDYQSYVQASVTHFFNHRDVLTTIMTSSQEDCFAGPFHEFWRECGKKWSLKYSGSAEIDDLYDSYMFYGIYNIYKSWITGGCVKSTDQVRDLIVEMVTRAS